MRFESSHRMAVVGSGENNYRHRVRRNPAQNLKTIQIRHLYVKHQKVGLVGSQCTNGFAAILAFGNDLNPRFRTQHQAQLLPSQRFIVGNYGSHDRSPSKLIVLRYWTKWYSHSDFDAPFWASLNFQSLLVAVERL